MSRNARGRSTVLRPKRPAASDRPPRPAGRRAPASSGTRSESATPAAGRVAPDRLRAGQSEAPDPPARVQVLSPRRRRWNPASLPVRVRRMLLALVLAGLGGGAAWLVFSSPVLGVRQVVIEGESTLRERDVRASIDVPAGVPLARVDTASVAARVARIPQVAKVRVDRRWPDTLAVVVTDRIPLAVVPTASSYAVVDRQGVQLRTALRAPEGYPVVSVGGGPSGRAALPAALSVLDSLPAGLRADVRQLSARTPEGVILQLSGDRQVRWGSAEQLTQKSAVLAALLRSVPRARVYDVSAPSAPTASD